MTLALDILAALSATPTQHARLIVLHTPLGRDVLVAERAEVDEAIGPLDRAPWDPGAEADADGDGDTPPFACSRVVVHALSGDAHLELKALIGQPVLLEMLTSASRTELRPFHGHVTEAALVGSDGGLARYRLVVEPWLSFLGHGRDAYAFQGKTVIEIVEEIFGDHAGQGRLVPAWRWELVDRAVYPQRSLCIQYRESDLAFVFRLLREEGLFCWFEHTGAPDDDAFGAHTLVIADHNGAFEAGQQATVRYTKADAVLVEDSMTRWRDRAALQTASLELASHDFRSLSMRPQSKAASPSSGASPVAELVLSDVPGAYAYEDAAQGDRLATRQMEAIDSVRARAEGRGTVRTMAPGTTFTLVDHPVHDGRDVDRDRFVALAVRTTARSNLRADQRAWLASIDGALAAVRASTDEGHTAHHVFGEAPKANRGDALPNQAEAPMVECRVIAQRAAVPVRLAAIDADGLPDPRLHARPTVHGVQTAVVVGAGGDPIHTDRDHRIRVQFHWQRGARSSHRLEHGTGADNAPASDASGTWVRVATGVAGANWGGVFAPRIGQEVLVQFVAGDIDRAVVIGAVYNGQGSVDAPGNQVAAGAAGAGGNAAAWFPGTAAEGKLESHRHAAVLAGYKSQEMSGSGSGSAGFNQLVFDDSPAGGRIELSSTTAQTRLQLGHLLNQNDNRRLQLRGHGIDLSTAAWGAVRAGSGLLVSAHGKAGSTAAGSSLDSREPQTQIEQSQQLLHTLAESAQQHKAMREGEPNVIGAKEDDASKQLPSEKALRAVRDSLAATQQRSDASSGSSSGDDASTIGGGGGSNTAWSRPDLVLAAPSGVATFTPAASVWSAGNTLSVVAGQDLQLAAQANHAWAVADGIVFFTYGKATDTAKPNQETGIALHAATGNVNAQSQSGATRLTADKAITVSSVTGMVRVTAPEHVLLTAAGAALDIQPGSITLKGPGRIEFKASMKELTGPGSASQSLDLKSAPYKPCSFRMSGADASGSALVPAGGGQG